MNEHKHFFVCLCVCLSVVASLVNLYACVCVCSFWACVCASVRLCVLVAADSDGRTEMMHFKLKCECKRKLQKKH